MDASRFIHARAHAIDASGIRKVFDLAAQLEDPINFSIGQPDFDVPPNVRQAAIDAIQSRQNAYTVTQGIAPLRRRIAEQLDGEFGHPPDGVLVVSGVSGGLLLTLMACVGAGDEVLFVDPYFVMYKHLTHAMGATPVMVSAYPDFDLPIDALRQAITPRTKLLLINSPANPTGRVIPDDQLRAAAALAREHDLLIVSDEIYLPLSYDRPSPSIYPHAPERTILLRGFSKGHGMTGWRLGYAAGPAAVLEAMTRLQQYTFVCAPSMVQYAGLAALDTPVDDRVREYRDKRDLVYGLLKDRFEVVRPEGGFYVFPKAPAGYASASEFVARAIENNVLIIPGNVFSECDTHFRISYATGNDRIRRGCEILCGLAQAS